MASVRAPHGSDVRGVARSREPVMDRCPDAAALDRRIAWTMMPRDQQQQAVAASNRLIKPTIDRTPCGVEAHAMEVEHPIRCDSTVAKAFIPTSVEGAFR